MTDRLIKREKEKEKGTEQWWQKIIAAGEKGDGAVPWRRKIMRERKA